MPSFKCEDMGFRCTFEVSAANMDELMQKIITHSRETHNMKNIPHDKIVKIKQVIRD